MKNEMFDRHACLADAELLQAVRHLTAAERGATVQLIAALAELDARRLYLAEGYSSLFTYCTQALHLSEDAAYGRIEAARAARRWPIVLELLADGSLHLTAVALLNRHLTRENHQEVLAAARHKTKREVEEIVAALRPQAPVPSTVRRLPAASCPLGPLELPRATPTMASAVPERTDSLPSSPAAGGEVARPAHLAATPRRPVDIRPLAPEQYAVRFTVPRETYDKLRHAQVLLARRSFSEGGRHRVPEGDVAAIFDRALTLLVAELERTKHAAVSKPRTADASRTTGRHIPASVRREVWERDGGRCAFVGGAGRCTERGCLEYHHLVPYADGGETTAANLALRCRAHNRYEADRWFGVEPETVRA